MEKINCFYRDKLGRGQDGSLGSWSEKYGPELPRLENDDIGSSESSEIHTHTHSIHSISTQYIYIYTIYLYLSPSGNLYLNISILNISTIMYWSKAAFLLGEKHVEWDYFWVLIPYLLMNYDFGPAFWPLGVSVSVPVNCGHDGVGCLFGLQTNLREGNIWIHNCLHPIS